MDEIRYPFPRLEAPRLRLRAFAPADVLAIVTACTMTSGTIACYGRSTWASR